MKHFYLSLVMVLASMLAQAQNFSLNELLSLNNTAYGKFQNYASKKGFYTEKQQKDYVKMQYSRDSTRTAYLVRQWDNDGGWMRMEKLTETEYHGLKASMQQDGYVIGKMPGKENVEVFEKTPMIITAISEASDDDSGTYYNIVIQKKILPRPRDLQFAEDLLQLDSHQQLEYVFGQGNITKDLFIYPDGTTSSCTVIYPQSSAEAVFIWKDKTNYRMLESIRVGGNSNTKGSLDYNRVVEQNRWASKQGVYPTMTLDKLCALNEASIKFYGWGATHSGGLYPENKGKLDFSQISFVFSCFNCNEQKYYGDKPHNAEEALNEYRRIHIATLVLKPKQEE